MANTALIKRSSVANKAPTTSDLSLGELAVNTYDGKLFLKKSVGGTESIVDLTNADKLDGQDGSYYTGYTDTAIANLINSAPSTLDTLSEIASALNNDAALNTTLTNAIATKLPLAGGTLTGNLTISNIQPRIRLNDSNNNPDYSILNEDGIFGIYDDTNSSHRLTISSSAVDINVNLDANAGLDVTGTCTATTFSGSGASLTNIPAAQLQGVLPALDGSNLTGIVATGTDAATLDSLDSTQFLRSDTTDTFTGNEFTFSSSSNQKIILQGATDPYIRFKEGTINKAYIQWNSSNYLLLRNQEDNSEIRLKDDIEFSLDAGVTRHKIFHAGNDGSGSGLDSDTLDGVEGTNYLRRDIAGSITGALTIDVDGTDNGATTLLTLDNYIADIGTEYTWIDFTFRDSNTNATPQVRIGAQAQDPTASQVQEGTADFVVQCGVDNSGTANTMTEMFRCSHETKITSVHHEPQSDSNFDLGTSSVRWRNIYADTLYGNGANITNVNATTLDSIDSGSFLRSDANDTLSAIITGHSSNTEVIRLNSAAYSSSLYLGGWNTTNTNDIARIRASSNLHIDSQANGNLYLNWYASNKGIYLGNTGQGIYAAGSNVVFHAGNDGAGSGLDSDTLDGEHGSYYADAASYVKEIRTDDDITARMDSGFYETATATTAEGWPETTNSWYHLISSTHSNTGNYYSMQIAGNFFDQKFYIRNTHASGTRAWSQIWTTSSDGSGSGLDSDTLDGIEASSFVRSDADDTLNGQYIINDSADEKLVLQGSTNPLIRFKEGTTNKAWLQWHGTNGYVVLGNNEDNTGIRIDAQLRVTRDGFTTTHQVWDAGNDGSGSGLDSDTVDGLEASSFIRSDANDTATGQITLQRDSSSTTDFSLHIRNQQSAPAQIKFSNNATNQNGYFFYDHRDSFSNSAGNSWHFNSDQSSTAVIIDQTAGNSGFYVGTNEVWHAGNDGSGSNLDSDTVDGIQASSFLRLDADNTVTSYQNKTTWPSSTSIGTASGHQASLEVYQSTNNADAFMAFHVGGDYAAYFGLDGGTNDFAVGGWSTGAVSYKVYHAGNDGSGSGLDADTLDGKDLSNSYTSTNSVVMRDSNGNMNAHYATLRKDVAGGVGAYLTIQNQSNNTNTSCGITFGAGTSNAILDGGDYGEAQIKCFRDSGGYGNLEINLHTGANRPVMKMIGNGGAYNGAGAGTEGMRGGVAFGNAGIAIDRSWMGQPGIHVFNANVENDTDQGTFRFHGWNRSYASYPNNTGSDFGVTLVADGMTLTSDRRRKTGISTITDALATVLQMRGVSYTYVNEELQPQTHMSMDNGKKLGFIAQEVIPLLPQLIHDSGEKAVERENGYCDRYNMDYGGVAPLLVEAIKELVQRIVALESK